MAFCSQLIYFVY